MGPDRDYHQYSTVRNGKDSSWAKGRTHRDNISKIKRTTYNARVYMLSFQIKREKLRVTLNSLENILLDHETTTD